MLRLIPFLSFGDLPRWVIIGTCCAMAQVGLMGQEAPPPATTPAVSSDPITRVLDFWALSVTERSKPQPFDLEFQVLYNDPEWGVVQVKDASAFEYIEVSADFRARAGDVVRMSGLMAGNPYTFALEMEDWRVVSNEPLAAETVDLSELDHAAFADHLVSISGLAENQFMADENHLTLEMVVDGSQVNVVLLLAPDEPVPQWTGSMLRVKGVHAPKIDAQGRVTLIEMWSPGTDCVEWIGPLATAGEFDRPARPVTSFLGQDGPEMALVRGEYVGESRDGRMLVRDESGQISVRTARRLRPKVGSRVEVVGLTHAPSVEVSMSDALWRPSSPAEPTDDEIEAPLLRHRVAASVRELSPLQAAAGQPVQITGAVTWSDPDRGRLFVQDSSSGIAVRMDTGGAGLPAAGKLVSIEGVTAAGDFAPFVAATAWQEVADVEMPTARSITRDQAMTGLEEAQLVELIGFVFASEAEDGELRLDISTAQGEMVARVAGEQDETRWLGALVEVTGVCVARADEARRLVAAEIWVADAMGIEVLQGGLDDPFMRPLTPMRELGRFNPNAVLRDRLRMEGTVVWVEASGEIWIRGEGVTLPVQTRQAARPREGERIEVVGFLGMNAGQRILREVVWRSVGLGEVLTPTDVADHAGEPRHGSFATITGRVQAISGQEGRVRMVLSTDDDPAFVVEIGDADPDQVRIHAPLGATVDVSGLVLRMANPAPGEAALRLMVYEIGDIRTVQYPPWWTRERLMIFGFLAILLVLAALLWVTLLRRVVQKQTTELHAQNSRARELQEELEKTQRLESMGSMAEGITQDFEQLLQRIHFQLGEVLDGERFSWEARNRLDQAQAAVLRAQDLTRRLASFSLTGRSVLRSVEWGKILRRELDSFELGPTIKLTANLPDGDTLARLDAAQFQQVIRGLLRNAVQAMPNGGTLKIELKDEQIKTGDMNRLLPTGHYLRTEISDTGNGIPAEDLNRVFDPYFTRKQGAKGLGLAVAYAVVRQHKGRIEVDSTEGKGTTVTLWLPKANPEAPLVGRGSG